MRRTAVVTTVVAMAATGVAGCGDDDKPPARTAVTTATATSAPAGRILYSADTGSGYRLYTIAPDGSGRRQITRGPGDAVQGDWSPDGRRIVFEFDRPDEKGCAIVLIDADGGGRRDLSGPDADCDGHPSFTPDGRRIVFVRYDAKADRESIQSMDLTGGDVRVIGGRTGDTDPNVSPDGRTVTFLRIQQDETRQALFAMGIDGTRVRRLTPYEDEVARKHDWSPDGRRIVLTTNADWVRPGQSANLLTIAPDGSGRRRLTRFTGGEKKGDNAFAGSYSPDGRHIALRVERDGIGGLAIVDAADGRHLHLITKRSEARPRFIDWGTGR